jgi:hypothetical protein
MALIDQDNSDHWINYPKPGEQFIHYKGGLYEVITLAKDSRDDQTVVVYKSLLFGSVHTRPLPEWFDQVPTTSGQGKRKSTTYRFKRKL